MGLIEIQDVKKIFINFHKYILIQKKKILGTDVKVFLNNDDFKLNEKMNQEYLNSVNINSEKSTF